MSMTLIGTNGLFSNVGWKSRLIRTMNGAAGPNSPGGNGDSPGSAFWDSTNSGTPSVYALGDLIKQIRSTTPNNLNGDLPGATYETLVSGYSQMQSQFQTTLTSGNATVANDIQNLLLQMAQSDLYTVQGQPYAPPTSVVSALAVLIGQMIGAGSGATVTYTQSGGALSAITTSPVAGGTGYPPSATIQLLVEGGVGGIVQATTNSSGVITAFSATPTAVGSGYAGATGAATTSSASCPQTYIAKPTVSATLTSPTNPNTTSGGSWKMAVSTISPLTGLQSDYLLAETINVICNSAVPNATQGSEPLTFTGQPILNSNPLYFTEPSGSGISQTVTITDPTLAGNVVADGVFAQEAGGTTPAGGSYWATWGSAPNGFAGSTMFATGDTQGSLQLSATQGVSIPVTLTPNTTYAFNLNVKGTSLTGTLTMMLVKTGSTSGSFTVLVDNNGTPNSTTLTGSTWAEFTDLTTAKGSGTGTFFRTNASTTSAILVLYFSSTATATVWDITGVSLEAATGLQYGDGSTGLYVDVFRGATDAALSDYAQLTVANNWTTSAVWALMMNQIFGLRKLGLQVPSSAWSPPYVLESLIS